MKKIRLNLVLLITFIIISGTYLSVSANYNLNSEFLKNNDIANTIVSADNYQVLLEKSTNYNSFSYDFLMGISMLGHRTYGKKSFKILDDFRIANQIPNYGTLITKQDLLSLDRLLNDQEILDLQRINFYKNLYPKLNIITNNNILNHHYLAELFLTISYLPKEHSDFLKTVKINNNLHGYNGYGGYGEIEIKVGYLLDNIKFKQVFLHEMGHIVDTGLTGTKDSGYSSYTDDNLKLYNNDLSLGFFNISWENENIIKNNLSRINFVSDYAMTNAFEDFAESYSLYVGNGNTFRCLAKNNLIIQNKYNYFKNYIFKDREYFTGKEYCQNLKIENVTDL